MYRGAYNGWGYSPLNQISTRNVAQLTPVWTVSTGITEGHESPPIVNDGIMFVTTPMNRVLAIDAATGDVRWSYQRQMPFDIQLGHPTNRGVALYGDKVYMATSDVKVVAFDAATGEVAWEQTVEDYHSGYYMTLAPLAVHGKILVGVSGGERGRPGSRSTSTRCSRGEAPARARSATRARVGHHHECPGRGPGRDDAVYDPPR
jgi:alcohol dehydrogenase (cytochrome c)